MAAPRPRPFRPELEGLEERCVPTGLNTFARLASDSPGVAAVAYFHIGAPDFTTLAGGRVFLNFTLRAAGGESFDPTPLTPQRYSPAAPLTCLQRHDASGESASLTMAYIGAGVTGVRLPTAAAGRAWTVDVALMGDANADFRVDGADLTFINGLAGRRVGEAAYRREADVDGDGAITGVDAAYARYNVGAATRIRPFGNVAALAPTSDADGNRVVLTPTVDFAGQTLPGAVVRVDLGADGLFEQILRADAAGRYRFRLTLPRGTSVVNVAAMDNFAQQSLTRQEVTFGDVIHDWNAVHLTAIRDYTVFSQVPYTNRIVHTAPPRAARNLAMMHAAMVDAIAAIDRTLPSYRVRLTAAPGASASAAAAAAAHRVLTALYPRAEQLALFNAALGESLASVPDGPGETAGIVVGQQAADAILAWRTADGSTATRGYTPGTDAGDWRLTPPDFIPALLPQWPGVTPFAVASVAAYRAAAPPALGSVEYAGAVNEVKELGRHDSRTRTAEQTAIAVFWADGPGTFTPAGHWNQIAQDVSLRRGLGLAANARLFALLNIAMADAGIASWDAKYQYELWRPITAIREADRDGNELTVKDETWAPLLLTPPFPSYTSGHSTFSAAAAAVLAGLFGDAVTFTSRQDGQDGFTQRPLAGGLVTRTFTSFSQAATEAGRSRVYGGIHFEFDSTAGLAAGRAIGTYVVDTLLR